MELKDFITQTIVQITEGVAEAQKQVKNTGCLINPEGLYRGERQMIIGDNQVRTIQHLKMKVAITTIDEAGIKKGIGVVASVFNVGVSATDKEVVNSQNAIEFEIPIALPIMK